MRPRCSAGMAPLRSQIRNQLLDVGTKRRITFWYGARSVQEMFYDEEFKDLEAKLSSAPITEGAPALGTTPDAGQAPELPSIDDMLPKLLPSETRHVEEENNV